MGKNKSSLFRRSLCAVFAAAALLPGGAAAAQQTNNAHHTISSRITADLGSKKNTIPANFVGVSVPEEDLYSSEPGDPVCIRNGGRLPCEPGPIFKNTNTSLISLLNLLGPNGYVHFGAASSKPAPDLTSGIAADLGGFMHGLGPGWTLNYGLDAKVDEPANPGAVATAVHQAHLINNNTTNPVDFSVGNEANSTSNPLTNLSTWNANLTNWKDIFNSYYTALGSPSNMGASEYADNFGWPMSVSKTGLMDYINATIPKLSGLALATSHWYPISPGTVTAAKALSAVSNFPWNGWPDKSRMTELSLTWGGGGIAANDASDRQYTEGLVSATWFLETSIAAATANPAWRGVGQFGFYTVVAAHDGGYPNILSHNNCLKQSGPIIDGQPTGSDWSPAPCFYGWYLMSMMEGQRIVADTTSGVASPANVAEGVYVLTTKNKSGNANILIVNGNQHATYHVTPGQSSPWSAAKVYQLGGTSCTDKTPTLNGKPIGNGGSWAGTPKTLKHGGTLTIPACGAAVVEIQGRGHMRRRAAFNASSARNKKAGPRAVRSASHHKVRTAKSRLQIKRA